MSKASIPTEELTGGELKVWYIPQLGMNQVFEFPVPDLLTAKYVLNAIYDVALFEYEHRVKPDFANIGGISRFEVEFHGGGSKDFTGQWCDVEEDELDEVSA